MMMFEQPLLRVFLRWRVKAEDIEVCYDCGIDLLLGNKDTPRVRVPHVTQDAEKIMIRCDPLCWRCWRRYQDRGDATGSAVSIA